MLKLKSKVGPKGQVVIPKPLREYFGIVVGEEIYFHVEDDELILEKKSGEEVLQEYLNEIEDKKPEPRHVDWDKEYYSQFGD